MKSAVAYARFSSANQRDESITAQLRGIYDYAAKNDVNIVKVYTDEALSATTDDRPNFQLMIAELPSIRPDFVLVHKLDRFARNKYDAAFYRREINKNHARLIAVEQDFGEGPEAELMEGILEGFAEYFSSNLGREVKKGLTENAMQGKHCGGIPPLGYDVDKDGKYIINEAEAAAIHLIFNMKVEGKSHKEIQDELNRLGYKSKTGRPIGSNSLHDILRNEKYAGVFILRKTSPNNSRRAADPSKTLRIENALPRLIEQPVFDRVQEMLNSAAVPRHHTDKPMRYLLTGIIRCGICGGAMSGVTVRKNKESATRGYYQCGKAKRTGECQHKKRYPKRKLENDVLDKIEQLAKSIKDANKDADRIIKRIKKSFPSNNTHRQELEKALHKAEQEFTRLTNAIASGADPRFLTDKFNEIGQRREELRQELNITENNVIIDRQEIIGFLMKIQSIKIDREDETSCSIAIGQVIKDAIVCPGEELRVKLRGLV